MLFLENTSQNKFISDPAERALTVPVLDALHCVKYLILKTSAGADHQDFSRMRRRVQQEFRLWWLLTAFDEAQFKTSLPCDE